MKNTFNLPHAAPTSILKLLCPVVDDLKKSAKTTLLVRITADTDIMKWGIMTGMTGRDTKRQISSSSTGQVVSGSGRRGSHQSSSS